jgi:methionyl-tRNA formyltransferase
MAYKIIFFGTSDFAVPSLEALSKDPRFEIFGVVTQPDRPVGRHAVLTAPPIKQFALSVTPVKTGAHPRLQQPEKIKDEDFQSWIKDIGPSCDAFVVVSYGKILPQWLLDLPAQGVVNVHGSLLPRWRGASPIQAAIAAGDTVSGVTIMKIDAEMDHGPLLATVEEPIREDDTGNSLHDRLATLGADILPDVLSAYLDGKTQPTEQDHTLATYCKTLTRDDGKLDFTKSSRELERLIRAYNPWPGTWTELKAAEMKRLKVLAVRVAATTTKPPGEFFIVNGRPHVACDHGESIELVTVQPEGKKAMSGEEFVRGSRQ